MGEIADLIRALRSAAGVQSIVAPYNGTQLGLVADTSFVVFENEKQQESLGARTTALGVDRSFDPVQDYYVNFHDLNPNAPTATLGAPCLRHLERRVRRTATRSLSPPGLLITSAFDLAPKQPSI